MTPPSAIFLAALERMQQDDDGSMEILWPPCMDCGGPASFQADEDLWAEVMGLPDAGIVCIRCFVLRAEAKDITDWHLRMQSWPRLVKWR